MMSLSYNKDLFLSHLKFDSEALQYSLFHNKMPIIFLINEPLTAYVIDNR